MNKKFMEVYKSIERPTMRELQKRLGIQQIGIYQLAKEHNVEIYRDFAAIKEAAEKGKRTREMRGYRGVSWGSKDAGWRRIPAQFVAGTSELIVCADLLRRGIPVYRAMTAVSLADMVGDFEGELKRIEVKTVQRDKHGRMKCGIDAHKRDRFDILAMVTNDAEIVYVPNPFVIDEPTND